MIIKLDNISKYYYSANAVVPALRKLSLEFRIGEFVAITGESGSGKSTLLSIISGMDSYDDGELYVNGEPTSYYGAGDWEEYRKSKIGFVFQNYNLIEHYSVLNNVESALLIQGCNVVEAKRIAKELIEKVGLSKQLYQRASKLSSGQKQRLSIARALAKNTDVIIADEPTGNLDSENGRQIMELLSNLSKDKLIITVTHNYDEASPYVTRKIRMHDGEIVSDTRVEQTEEGKTEEEKTEEEKTEEEKTEEEKTEEGKAEAGKAEKEIEIEIDKEKIEAREELSPSAPGKPKSYKRIASRFTWMNITTQPQRAILYLLFLMITAAVTFVFLGDIYSNWDDTFTKKYDSSLFFNGDNTRIVIKKPDGSNITDKDIAAFRGIKYVEMADQYDYANDVNYYFTLGTDYEYTYQPSDNSQSLERSKTVKFLKWNNFMKSSTCITKEDLRVGRLPEERNEIVIYTEDESLLGTEQECYFSSQNYWNYNEYYTTNLKIVGILDKESSQVFFSRELCNMLSLAMYPDHYNLLASKNIFTGSYTTNINIFPVIGEGLKPSELRVSIDLAGINGTDISGEAEVTAYHGEDKISYPATVLSQYQMSSLRFVEISEEWFYQLYQRESKQASVYIRDYIDTDYVLGKLERLGYDAISPYRFSSVTYDREKLNLRNETMIKALFVLLITGVLEILIVSSIMKIRNRDFKVLMSLGMNFKTMKRMNYCEMYIDTLISVGITVIVFQLLARYNFSYLINMIKYYNLAAYAIHLVLNFAVITITVWLFNRYLKHKQNWS